MLRAIGGLVYWLCLEVAETLGLLIWCIRKPGEAGQQFEDNMELIRRYGRLRIW